MRANTGYNRPPALQKKIVGGALRHLPGTLAIGCQWDVPKSQTTWAAWVPSAGENSEN